MPRYFLELSYIGTAYNGWQNQPASPSVQAEVERALRFALHREKVSAVGCGRTDTGVHASLYYAHFDGPDDRELDQRFAYRLNGSLPPDIAVHRVIPVPGDAHARFSATERGYVYRIHRHKDPFLTHLSHQLRPPLDVAAMNEACRALVGRQDFSSFCKAGSDAKTMLCDVRLAQWDEVPGGYRFRIRADRFLRNMVRAVVGTCLRIGHGHEEPASMARVIAARDRTQAGKSAPARGLYLEHVLYPFIDPPAEPPTRAPLA
jgi:tRNA pseudouridine38-40 synthase